MRNFERKVSRLQQAAVRVGLLTLVLFSTGLSFSSCSEGEGGAQTVTIPVIPTDPITNDSQQKKDVVFHFEFSPGKDLIGLADFTVALTGPDGKVTTEKVTSFPWKASVTGIAPCTAGYAFTILPKNPLELKQDIYDFSVVYNNSYKIGSSQDYSFSNNLTTPVSKSKVLETLEQVKDLYQYSYTVKK